jgi:hypothetical protein
MIGASNTAFKPRPPKLLADSVIQSKGNNIFAGALQAGSKKQFLDDNTGGKGFSRNAGDAMRAEQNYAANAAKGAQGVAGLESDAQAFNNSQTNAYQMSLEQGLLAKAGQDIDINSITFDRLFNRKAGNARLGQQRQQADLNIRLALLAQGLA